MKDDFRKVVTLVSKAGKIEGRKKLHKIVYILQQLGRDFDEKYVFHHYGPYSPELQMELDTLVDSDLVREEVKNEKGYETYIYESITEDNYFFLDDFLEDKDIDLVTELNIKQSTLLEVVATLFYLKDKGYESEEALKKKTKILKPEKERYIDRAYDIFEELSANNDQ